tara:strand:+ start:77 stop:643 length:567 start_codon:yes stop_codon:yes gene_type:complete
MVNSESKIIELPKVGEVLLERSYRAKHVNISVKPTKKVRVAVPVGVTFDRAHNFVKRKEHWIEKQILKFSDSSATPIFDTYAAECFIQEERYLVDRVESLAKKHGFQYCKLKFRVMKTRWGSCSAKNNINLNMLIMYLPKHLQDYIILHELVHTRIKNHSNHFWNVLDGIVGDARGMNKELKLNYTLV